MKTHYDLFLLKILLGVTKVYLVMTHDIHTVNNSLCLFSYYLTSIYASAKSSLLWF